MRDTEDDELVSSLAAAAERGDLEDELRALLANASERLEWALGEIDGCYETIEDYESHEPDEVFAYALYDAIVERRREDAVELLAKMFSMSFMEPKAYQRLFPQRVADNG